MCHVGSVKRSKEPSLECHSKEPRYFVFIHDKRFTALQQTDIVNVYLDVRVWICYSIPNLDLAKKTDASHVLEQL